MELEEGDPLRYVVSEAKKYKLKEVKHYEQLVTKYATVEELKNKFEIDTRSRIINNAEKNRSKFKTYLTVNPYLETPKVFDKLYYHKNISMISKLRMSAHNLQIEMGRRTGTPANLRKCHCGEMEDELHFLLRCRRYADIRARYAIGDEKKVSEILNDSSCGEYISCLYDRRSECIAG